LRVGRSRRFWDTSIQVDARDKSDLDEKDIVVRLRKAGGADYNGGRG
jgi:hypothetical protein